MCFPCIALKDKGLFLSLLWLPYGEIDEKKDGFWCLELINQSINLFTTMESISGGEWILF